ncbi:MAG TPA: hypothetical protein VL346_03180, partial [Acidobacteriaceae bacterium]|nr:hypothetical protein [Acidobacteriaceae bacterium]
MSEPTLSPGNPVAIAPLHNPHFAVAFKPLHTGRASAQTPKESAAAKVPLFLAALLYLAGIALTHCVYLPPGPLLLSLLALAVIAMVAVYRAARLAWLPMLALWMGLGAWSAAMEPQPVVNARLAACISDGLLRTVEGVVTAAEPVRADSSEDAGDNSDPGSAF